jgi:hypothetical protein
MNQSATQQFIDLAGIKDGIVITTNGGYRIIFNVGVTNFSLKSEEEQNSIIFQYQGFLNSLHFPIEIVMRSKRLDLNPYIKKLSVLKDKQNNELLRVQMEDYIDFVGELVNMANIMKKNFYVVVPYDPIEIKKPSVFGKIFGGKGEGSGIKIADTTFKRYKDQLTERANTVASGLGSLGLHCVQLTTEEIIELFYGIYNPEVADIERFSDVEELTSSLVTEKENINQEKENSTEEQPEENVIDNSALVEDQQKKAAKQRELEAEKEVEKGGAPSSAPTETPAPNTVMPVAPQALVQTPVKAELPASAPAEQGQAPTTTNQSMAQAPTIVPPTKEK